MLRERLPEYTRIKKSNKIINTNILDKNSYIILPTNINYIYNLNNMKIVTTTKLLWI